MKSIELTVSKRENLTKQDTKKLRNTDMIPCVMYGGQETLHFYAPVLSFRELVYTPNAYIVKINLDGTSYDGIIQEIQFHPVSDKILHIDFLQVLPDKPVTMLVPVSLSGTSEGVKQGGKLITKARKLKLKALASDLPDAVSIDITPLMIGDSVRVGDMKLNGVEFLDSPNNIIVGVRTTRNVAEETPAEAEKPAAEPAEEAAPAE